MKVFNKTMDPERDYEIYDGIGHVQNIVGMLQGHGVPHRFDHPHRAWEYGLAIDASQSIDAKHILDVGGGGGVFAPAIAYTGVEVLQVDPDNVGGWIAQQSQLLGRPITFVQSDFMLYHTERKFDAVVCLSVIEHVEDDRAFFKKLLTHVKRDGLLILTTDFAPDGLPHNPFHRRTYNTQQLKALVKLSRRKFRYHGRLSYGDHGGPVNGYNFASVVLKRCDCHR